MVVAGIAIAVASRFGIGSVGGVIAPIMLYLFGMGIAMPNAIAAAMAPHGRMAGACSSLIGALQTGAGALSGACVAAFYHHTSASLSYTVAILSLMAAVAHKLGRHEPTTS